MDGSAGDVAADHYHRYLVSRLCSECSDLGRQVFVYTCISFSLFIFFEVLLTPKFGTLLFKVNNVYMQHHRFLVAPLIFVEIKYIL